MLNSFHIKNYKNLKDLKLDSLAQINLISGRNNTGKSSLLQAISIFSNREVASRDNSQFIHTNNINKEVNSMHFDRIALTDKKKYIIEALKTIEPKTKAIAFVENNQKQRVPVIKLTDAKGVIYLSSMGDGINRILTIILALVNAENGFLLIDEFENGLHFTAQEQLWSIIFRLSSELNVQVFATTHSNDCLASFGKISNNKTCSKMAKFIRLDNINGQIKPIDFTAEELEIAEQQQIEIR